MAHATCWSADLTVFAEDSMYIETLTKLARLILPIRVFQSFNLNRNINSRIVDVNDNFEKYQFVSSRLD